MGSPSRACKSIVLACALGLATPVLARAECVQVPFPKGAPRPDLLKGVTLAFLGKVTAVGVATYGVSFQVERVWVGELHRDTMLFVVPGEGTSVRSFQPGVTYIVMTTIPVTVLGAQDVAGGALPAGTLGVTFGCAEPVPLREAAELLKDLGRGRSPLE